MKGNDVPEIVFKKACIRFALHFKLTEADEWDCLSNELRAMFETLEYKAVIKAFICDDRNLGQMSWAQLEIKYGLPQTTIWRMAQDCCGGNPSDIGKETNSGPGKK